MVTNSDLFSEHSRERICIILGAGASCAEGAPSQSNLFNVFCEWLSKEAPYSPSHDMARELATFFLQFFKINIDNNWENAQFPTFEEVLGIVETAISRNEAFRGFAHENIHDEVSRVRALRRNLILLIAAALDYTLAKSKGIHRKLIGNLLTGGKLRNISFISFNYDILIDNALVDLYPHVDLDYSVDFTNFRRPDDWQPPRKAHSLFLYKMHGSLNWLFCPVCNELTLTPKQKAVSNLIHTPQDCTCKDCGTLSVPIIIPPTYSKVFSNFHLQQVWHNAERMLAESQRWVFCGYSLPDADMHVKYLLKRIEVNYPKPRLITVLNWHSKKKSAEVTQEKNRYEKFFGPSTRVSYERISFQSFAKNPSPILCSPLL